MTEKLTIKDLNCGNCPELRIDGDGDSWCSKCDWLFTTDFREDDITRVGCASHPLALQVLAAPIIEELRARNDNVAYPRFVSEWGMSKGRQEAINLLKEGVKKP